MYKPPKLIKQKSEKAKIAPPNISPLDEVIELANPKGTFFNPGSQLILSSGNQGFSTLYIYSI